MVTICYEKVKTGMLGVHECARPNSGNGSTPIQQAHRQ